MTVGAGHVATLPACSRGSDDHFFVRKKTWHYTTSYYTVTGPIYHNLSQPMDKGLFRLDARTPN